MKRILTLAASLTLPLIAASAVAQDAAQATPPLRLITKIPAPGMTGTWDHLTADVAGKRLFVSAQEDQVVRVFDLSTNQAIANVTADFNRPQGLFYVPTGLLAVSNGRDGTVKLVDGHTLKLRKSIPLTLGADMMDFDPHTGLLYIDHGGKDSNRGPGALAVIDTKTLEKVGDITTDWRPGSIELAKAGPRLFISLPGASQIGVIDRTTQQFLARFDVPAPAKAVAIALDEQHHRLFVGTRTPDKFFVLDMDSGKLLATLDSVGGISGMFFDAKHQRVYVSGLDGIAEVYQQVDPMHYKSLGRITLVPKAATSLFIPSLNRYYIAAPPTGSEPGQIWVFEPI